MRPMEAALARDIWSTTYPAAKEEVRTRGSVQASAPHHPGISPFGVGRDAFPDPCRSQGRRLYLEAPIVKTRDCPTTLHNWTAN